MFWIPQTWFLDCWLHPKGWFLPICTNVGSCSSCARWTRSTYSRVKILGIAECCKCVTIRASNTWLAFSTIYFILNESLSIDINVGFLYRSAYWTRFFIAFLCSNEIKQSVRGSVYSFVCRQVQKTFMCNIEPTYENYICICRRGIGVPAVPVPVVVVTGPHRKPILVTV